MSYEDHPELVGYVPNEGLPHRRRMLRVMRVVVLVGIACLVLPGIVVTWGVAGRSAHSACLAMVNGQDGSASGAVARFDWMGPAGPQWYCSAIEFGGRERLMGTLGLIPQAR